ncbi:MAG: MBL fold metallo-hydrolase [Dehalococcoidia bacterium]|nr:MBL fold metallo-hydrolase [Dehalococcoidia bacterium]
MAIEITWLGRTCFRLKGREGVVVTDPVPPDSGYSLGKLSADVVTLSRRADPAYSYHEGVDGDPVLLDAPGEYEVGGILVNSFATQSPNGMRNMLFVVELEGMRIAHLGVISPEAAKRLDDIKGVDILLLPVGGAGSLTGALATDVMATVDAKLAIPMHYRTDAETMALDPLDKFLKETGSKPEPEPKITITKTQLPTELTVRVLEPRS